MGGAEMAVLTSEVSRVHGPAEGELHDSGAQLHVGISWPKDVTQRMNRGPRLGLVSTLSTPHIENATQPRDRFQPDLG